MIHIISILIKPFSGRLCLWMASTLTMFSSWIYLPSVFPYNLHCFQISTTDNTRCYCTLLGPYLSDHTRLFLYYMAETKYIQLIPFNITYHLTASKYWWKYFPLPFQNLLGFHNPNPNFSKLSLFSNYITFPFVFMTWPWLLQANQWITIKAEYDIQVASQNHDMMQGCLNHNCSGNSIYLLNQHIKQGIKISAH